MRHDLFNPLTDEEIAAVARLVRAEDFAGDRIGFAAVFTDEPDKALVRAGVPVARRARAFVVDRSTGQTRDVRVDLDRGVVSSAAVVSEGAAPILVQEFERVAELVKKDPRYRQALAKRGITDTSEIQVDPWCVGNRPENDGRRLLAALSYQRHFRADNGYAHPVEGVLAIVDLATEQVRRGTRLRPRVGSVTGGRLRASAGLPPGGRGVRF